MRNGHDSYIRGGFVLLERSCLLKSTDVYTVWDSLIGRGMLLAMSPIHTLNKIHASSTDSPQPNSIAPQSQFRIRSGTCWTRNRDLASKYCMKTFKAQLNKLIWNSWFFVFFKFRMILARCSIGNEWCWCFGSSSCKSNRLWYDSELNFDALLLGGYFCHEGLP